MSPVSLKEARQRLSDLVHAAERGETVIIMRRGRQVARLMPLERGKRGRLPDLSAFRSTIKVKGRGLSKTVIAGRAQARY